MPASRVYERLVKRVLDQYSGDRVRHAGVPVISVGNIMIGGTGKTPLVIALLRFITARYPALASHNRIAVLSRGYGRTSRELVVVEADTPWQKAGDEPLVIKRSVPEAAVLVHPERVVSAAWAVKQLGAKLIILDDGFQHRKLARDLDIVVLDGTNPLGNGLALPAGPLRESPESLARATLFVGIGHETSEARKLSDKFSKPYVSAAPVTHWPEEIKDNPDCRIFALTSIARPFRFINSIRGSGLNLVGHRVFRDHHRFRPHELLEVCKSAQRAWADLVLCTTKDWARIANWPQSIPLVHAGLELRFYSDQEMVSQLERVGVQSVV